MNTNNCTLIVFEGLKKNYKYSTIVFNKICSVMKWHDAVHLKMDMTYNEFNKFEASGGYLDFISKSSSHALICTWDGFIVNPHLWIDEWLDYDMIGSPWPKFFKTAGYNQSENRVGNTGFCLMSRNFLKAAKESQHFYQGGPGDVFLCQSMYERFVNQGIKYAPVNLAARFGWEHYIEEGLAGPDKSFGFHGWVSGKCQEEYYKQL
jgi:hypothetical protein